MDITDFTLTDHETQQFDKFNYAMSCLADSIVEDILNCGETCIVHEGADCIVDAKKVGKDHSMHAHLVKLNLDAIEWDGSLDKDVSSRYWCVWGEMTLSEGNKIIPYCYLLQELIIPIEEIQGVGYKHIFTMVMDLVNVMEDYCIVRHSGGPEKVRIYKKEQ